MTITIPFTLIVIAFALTLISGITRQGAAVDSASPSLHRAAGPALTK